MVSTSNLSIPEGNVKWPLGGWLKLRATPGIVQRLDISGHATYDGPNGLGVVVTIDNTPRFGPLLHASISHHRRDPLWSEIKAMRAAFFPADIDVMMVLPAESDYVNLHEHAFHLVQTPERWSLR
jgi:hypothetical protein